MKVDASFLLALIIAIASTIGIIAGWFFFFFRGWFENWLKRFIEETLSSERADFSKFRKTTIKAVQKLHAEQVELDKTLKVVAKDGWKNRQHTTQMMEWAKGISKDKIYSFRPSHKAIESFDDYWGEVKLDLDNFQDPFATQPEKR